MSAADIETVRALLKLESLHPDPADWGATWSEAWDALARIEALLTDLEARAVRAEAVVEAARKLDYGTLGFDTRVALDDALIAYDDAVSPPEPKLLGAPPPTVNPAGAAQWTDAVPPPEETHA